MAIERGEDARKDGAEAAEPSEAAAAALAVADVVGASLLRVVRSRGGGWETMTAAERTMAREARGGIVRCLVSVGVLERAEGEGRVE